MVTLFTKICFVMAISCLVVGLASFWQLFSFPETVGEELLMHPGDLLGFVCMNLLMPVISGNLIGVGGVETKSFTRASSPFRNPKYVRTRVRFLVLTSAVPFFWIVFGLRSGVLSFLDGGWVMGIFVSLTFLLFVFCIWFFTQVLAWSKTLPGSNS